jgi:hypothetical protein
MAAPTTVRRTGVTTLLAAAIGFATIGTAFAAPAPQSFEVCSPLGCALQRVTGTADAGPSSARVAATAVDRAPQAALTVVLEFIDDGTVTRGSYPVDNSTRSINLIGPGTPETLRVFACATPQGVCTIRTIPLV